MRLQIIIGLALPVCGVSALQAQVGAPKVGVVRYSDGSVRNIFGLHADLIVSQQALGSAEQISFSDAGGLLAKDGHIQLVGPDSASVASYDCAESAPLLNIDGDLSSAIAWLPAEHALLRWNGKSFVLTQVNANLPGKVTSVRMPNPNTAKLLVTENGGAVSAATISLQTGDLVSLDLLAGVAAPAFEQQSFILFHDQRGLEIVSPSGAVRTLVISANDLTFERMSSDWLHIASATTKQNWILHLNGLVVQLSELPAEPVVSTAAVRQEDGK